MLAPNWLITQSLVFSLQAFVAAAKFAQRCSETLPVLALLVTQPAKLSIFPVQFLKLLTEPLMVSLASVTLLLSCLQLPLHGDSLLLMSCNFFLRPCLQLAELCLFCQSLLLQFPVGAILVHRFLQPL